MSVLAKKNTPPSRTPQVKTTSRRSLRELTRYVAHEARWQFVIEALLFGVLVAISAWPAFTLAETMTRSIR